MESLMNKNAITNMKCSDEESFRWAVTRVLNPTTKNSERVTKILIFQQFNSRAILQKRIFQKRQ